MREFYEIIDSIRDSLRASNSINTVTFGEIDDIDLDKTTIFPLAHIFVDNVRHLDRTLEFNLSILTADIVDVNKEQTDDDDFYGNDNLHDVLNTQFGVMNEIISSLRRGSLYQEKYQLSNQPTIEPFKQRFKNTLAGWESTVSITVKNELKTC